MGIEEPKGGKSDIMLGAITERKVDQAYGRIFVGCGNPPEWVRFGGIKYEPELALANTLPWSAHGGQRRAYRI